MLPHQFDGRDDSTVALVCFPSEQQLAEMQADLNDGIRCEAAITEEDLDELERQVKWEEAGPFLILYPCGAYESTRSCVSRSTRAARQFTRINEAVAHANTAGIVDAAVVPLASPLVVLPFQTLDPRNVQIAESLKGQRVRIHLQFRRGSYEALLERMDGRFIALGSFDSEVEAIDCAREHAYGLTMVDEPQVIKLPVPAPESEVSGCVAVLREAQDMAQQRLAKLIRLVQPAGNDTRPAA